MKSRPTVSFVTDQRGVTLVELLISTALFGLTMVAVSSLFATQAKNSVRSSNDSGFNEQLSSFANNLETLLTNATRMRTCSCQGASGCVIGAAEECTSSGYEDYCRSSSTIEIETEGSLDPSVAGSGTECYRSGDRSATPEGMHGMGCKKIIRVTYTPPTAVSGSAGNWTVGTAGKITIEDRTVTGSPQTIQEFSGAYYFRCGQLPADSSTSSTPSPDLFRFEIRAKSRQINQTTFSTSTAGSEIDGWYPAIGSAAADPGFLGGTHRQFLSDITFRNWNVAGVHFGRTQTVSECISNTDATRNVNITSDLLCCSGYFNSVTSKCVARTACNPRGSGGPVSMCCSKMKNGAACL